jgi:hypothetical protein
MAIPNPIKKPEPQINAKFAIIGIMKPFHVSKTYVFVSISLEPTR